MRTLDMFILGGAMLAASPASAESELVPGGFTVTNSATVAAAPADVWAVLVRPAAYWNPDHGYSGVADNFMLEARAGGCFCERLSGGGSVEHMRVVMVQPGRMLRLSGALGPLQSEALTGTLSWMLEPGEDGGTRIRQIYKVAGHMSFAPDAIAPAVDGVLNEQLTRLAAQVSAPAE
ncbi:MAG: SRPBCC family protein [Pseudomonadota bacterium]